MACDWFAVELSFTHVHNRPTSGSWSAFFSAAHESPAAVPLPTSPTAIRSAATEWVPKSSPVRLTSAPSQETLFRASGQPEHRPGPWEGPLRETRLLRGTTTLNLLRTTNTTKLSAYSTTIITTLLEVTAIVRADLLLAVEEAAITLVEEEDIIAIEDTAKVTEQLKEDTSHTQSAVEIW